MMNSPKRQPDHRPSRTSGTRPWVRIVYPVAVLAALLFVANDITVGGTATAPRVANGGFEAGLRGWSFTGRVALSHGAHNGARAVRIGGSNRTKGNSTLSQTFSVPSVGGAIRFWYLLVCHANGEHDWAQVTLTNNATHKTTTLLPKTCTDDHKWRRVSANLAPYAGHRAKLTFVNHDDDRTGSPSFVFVDSITIAAPDFSLSTTRAAVVRTGASTKVKVVTSRTTGSAKQVRFSASNLPRGVTASWNPATVNAGASSTLTLTAAPSAPAEPSGVTITASSDTTTHTAPLVVSVLSPGAPPPTTPPTTPPTSPPPPPPTSCSGINLYPGANLQAAFDSQGSGTTFCFAPGTYVLTNHVRPKSYDQLIATTSRASVLTGQDQYDGGIVGSSGSGGEHDVLVQGFVVQHFVNPWTSFPRSAIQAGTNWVIRDNEVSYNSQSGVHVSDGTQLLGNYIHDNGRYGFDGGPVSSLKVDGNEISNNNTAHNDPSDDAGGDKIVGSSQGSTNVVFSNNYVHDNYGNGLWCDTNCIGAQITGNRVVGNYLAGIFYESAFGPAVIANNTLGGNCQGSKGESIWHCAEIFLNDSQSVEIRNNDISATTNGIAGADTERGSTGFGKLMICGVNVHDNTISLGSGGGNGLASNRSSPCSGTQWASSNNTVH